MKDALGENFLLIRFLAAALTVTFWLTGAVASGQSTAPCAPFRVHRRASLPPPPKIEIPEKLPLHWEENLVTAIGRVKTQEEFPKAYWQALKQNDPRSETERFAYLRCVLYYESFDSNQNGVPDWTALIDHRPAEVLYPQDPDMDGDGVPNVLDPSPLDSHVKGPRLGANEIPAHLRFDEKARPEAAALQAEIYRRFGILAIDHTDDHSSLVLREFLTLLEKGFFDEGAPLPRNLKYIYAFKGHDSVHNIAAFHLEAQALSIGGVSAYPENHLGARERAELVAALVHEIGHAFIFDRMTAAELADIADRFGGWHIKRRTLTDSFFSASLFQPHPLRWLAQQIRRIPVGAERFTGSSLWSSENIVSQYATTNVHEWFADAFAAGMLERLGELHVFGENWRPLFIKVPPRHSGEYWENYNNLSPAFRAWLIERLKK